MKKITTVLALFVMTLLATSCSKEPTLQEYLVQSQEKTGFLTFDVPVNFFKPKSDEVPEDVKKTIESIRKINVVALPYLNNEEAYEVEKTEIEGILSNENKYKTLMSVNVKGMKVKLYYTGTTDAIDEVVAFGYAKDTGVGVARILGEDMNPAMFIKMIQNLDVNGGGMNLNQFNFGF